MFLIFDLNRLHCRSMDNHLRVSRKSSSNMHIHGDCTSNCANNQIKNGIECEMTTGWDWEQVRDKENAFDKRRYRSIWHAHGAQHFIHLVNVHPALFSRRTMASMIINLFNHVNKYSWIQAKQRNTVEFNYLCKTHTHTTHNSQTYNIGSGFGICVHKFIVLNKEHFIR